MCVGVAFSLISKRLEAKQSKNEHQLAQVQSTFALVNCIIFPSLTSLLLSVPEQLTVGQGREKSEDKGKE